MEPTNGSFSARLRRVIGARKIDPWMRNMGIAAGTRSRMLKGDGVPPTYETLVRIMRAENVSLSWLLGGEVPPYLVTRTLDDVETATVLGALLEDEASWSVHLLIGGGRPAWLLYQQAEIELPKGALEYYATELIAGPLGPATLDVIKARRYGVIHGVHNIGGDTMRKIYAGELGTWQLLGDGHGLVDPWSETDINLTEQPDQALRVAEGEPNIPEPLQPLANWWPMLEDAERTALTTLLNPFLENVRKRHQDKVN